MNLRAPLNWIYKTEVRCWTMLIYCRVWLDWPSRSYRLLSKWWREPARMSNWECPKYHVCRVLPWNRRYRTKNTHTTWFFSGKMYKNVHRNRSVSLSNVFVRTLDCLSNVFFLDYIHANMPVDSLRHANISLPHRCGGHVKLQSQPFYIPIYWVHQLSVSFLWPPVPKYRRPGLKLKRLPAMCKRHVSHHGLLRKQI